MFSEPEQHYAALERAAAAEQGPFLHRVCSHLLPVSSNYYAGGKGRKGSPSYLLAYGHLRENQAQGGEGRWCICTICGGGFQPEPGSVAMPPGDSLAFGSEQEGGHALQVLVPAMQQGSAGLCCACAAEQIPCLVLCRFFNGSMVLMRTTQICVNSSTQDFFNCRLRLISASAQ